MGRTNHAEEKLDRSFERAGAETRPNPRTYGIPIAAPSLSPIDVRMIEIIGQTRFALGKGGLAMQAPLLLHVGAGILGIVTGYVALSAAKGTKLHRGSGLAFVYAMLVMALMGAAIAAVEVKPGSVDGGLLTAYLVATALMTVRPATTRSRRVEIGAMLLAVALGLANVGLGAASLAAGHRARDDVPVPMFFIFGGIALLSSVGDARMIRAGGLRGAPRLARHLWRMCFGLFIAAGSFFIGQAHLIPKPFRIYPLLAVPALAPLVAMAYWIWRVRIRQRLRGLVLASGDAAAMSPRASPDRMLPEVS